ncbi:MAG: dihydropteroate synthase [Verrucomicrobia bacterium]|nr:dihydropteroate synthase [Verrucomicrobiota bacterium]MDA1086623.1 dihydropteroate synthase [Verrucomicrobiota bacterium]
MPIDGLTIIGESINDSVPSTQGLFETGDIEGLRALARMQDERGATYIDVNVGQRPAEFLAEMIREVQSVTTRPLSIDTPDPAMAEAGLKAYDLERAGGKPPVLNSISPLRPEMFELYSVQPFLPMLMVSERVEGGRGKPNMTGEETVDTAKQLLATAAGKGIRPDQCIIDPAISPIGSDSEGHLPRIMETMRRIHDDANCAGVHMSVGLTNFTVMLPPKRPDGSPVKSALENGFLTLATPLGLDHVIGSVKRKYAILVDGDPALECVRDCLALAGFDSIMRVQEFYST